MWPKLIKYLARFESVVIIGRDADGYPFSLRCHPLPDSVAQVLRFTLPTTTPIQAGAAVLLCHAHDEKLWSLKNFNVRGELQSSVVGTWIFRPSQFIEGAGLSPLSELWQVLKLRAVTNRYLQKRNLPRPKIAWDEIKRLHKEAGN